ncbi:MAG: L28 family ribosomal protein [Candidatus Dojkabacteria bacterium]|nr:MAG: L28 family ribosomal protein [Candidatus Dojkabacteria bacterium]
MARRCDVCDKKTAHGDSHIHRHSAWRYKAPRTKRTWVPNLRPVKVTAKERTQEITMCMACYKRYTKDGSSFLTKKQVKELKGLTLV